MQQNNSVSFFAPGFDDAIEQAKLERQRKLAEAMMQQSQEPLKGGMAGAVYVPPSITQGLAQMFKAYSGGQANQAADERQSALAQAMQTRNKQEAQDFFSTLRGTPGTPEQNFGSSPERNLKFGEKNLDLTGQAAPDATIPAQAAVPGDQNKAIEMAFSAKSPMVQGYGSQLAMGQLQQQQMMDKLAAAMRMARGGQPAGAAPGAAPSAQVSPGAPGAPVTPGQPEGGSFGGVNPLAAALAVSGDPGLGKLGEMVADANKPLINRGYGLNKLNPATGNYELDPGSLQGIKDVETAKADIAASHDMVKVDTGNGQYTYVPRSQLTGKAAAPAAVAPPVATPVQPMTPRLPAPMSAAPSNPMAPQPGDADRTLILTTEMDAAQKRLAQLQTDPRADPDMVGRQQEDIASLTKEIQRDAARRPAGGVAGPPGPAPQSTTVQGSPVYGQSTADLHMQSERGKTLAEQEAKINADAESALAKIAQNNKMVDLIPSITSGPGAKAVTTVRTLAQNLGVDIGDPAPNQEFEKYAIKGALEGAKQIYGARLTNQDVMSQLASNPGTSMAEKALYELIKYDNILQQRHLDKQKQYFSYTGPKEQFGMWFNQNNPLMGVAAPAGGQSAAQTAPGRPTSVMPPAAQPSRLKANPDGSFTYIHQ